MIINTHKPRPTKPIRERVQSQLDSQQREREAGCEHVFVRDRSQITGSKCRCGARRAW